MVKRRSARSGLLTRVTPRLLVGNRAAAQDRELLRAADVAAVVSVGGGRQAHDDLAFWHCGVRDNCESDALVPAMREAADAIEGFLAAFPGRSVLVHCMGGVSRSPAFACAYLILKEGASPPAVLAALRAARPAARIAPPLLAALAGLRPPAPAADAAAIAAREEKMPSAGARRPRPPAPAKAGGAAVGLCPAETAAGLAA